MEKTKETLIIELDEKDCTELERLHYLVSSTADLIERLTLRVIQPSNFEEALVKYTKIYSEQYKEYENFKSYITEKYRPDSSWESWSAIFSEKHLIFER